MIIVAQENPTFSQIYPKNHYQIDAKIAAIELHWEKLLRVKGYYHQDSVFDLSSLDYLTPWNVRHHHLLKQLVQQPSTTQTIPPILWNG